MKLDLDPEALREQMALWRHAVDLRMDLRADIRSHLIVRRKDILANFRKTGQAWLTVLHASRPAAGSEQDFQALLAEVKEFLAWAEAGMQEIDRLSAD